MAAHDTLAGMIKRVSLWAFIVAGIAVVAWAAVSWASPQATCRGEAMGPGDTCSHLSLTGQDDGKVQTYEQRIAAARQQTPYGVAAGVCMVVFGAVLLRTDAVSAQGSSDIGP